MKSANKSTDILQIKIYLLLYTDVVSCPPGVVLDEHHSLCEQAIQCHFAVYDTCVTAVGNAERCDEGVDQ